MQPSPNANHDRAPAQRHVKAIAASVHGSAVAEVVSVATPRPHGK